MSKSIGIAVITSALAFGQAGAGTPGGAISAARIREHVKYLGSDALEGRGVGAKGGDLATEYLARQLALAGAKPAGDGGTYYQKVPLVGIEVRPEARLSASGGGKTVDFKWLDDFVGVNATQQPDAQFEAGVVFVGHGISAPEFHWDDYKGQDVSGKLLLMFTNEPPSNDPRFFDGRALTYYGRWTYKFEEGLRRGAAGVILMHTTHTAGYGWEVVRNSNAREEAYVKVGPGGKVLSFAGWVTREAGDRMLALAGRTVDELLSAADKPDFRPIDLGIRVNGRLPAKIRDLDTRNVAAMVPGSDPKLRDEVVVYSAHWDHLGIGTPVNGDAIYNGAIDNGTGMGILLDVARAWGALPHKPRRSALFLFFTAEEAGLRGSEYYAGHPLVPAARTAIDLNYDSIYPWGRAKGIQLLGIERTNLVSLAGSIARRMELEIVPDEQPEQGSYFRSDHFPLAHAGIPAVSIKVGMEFYGKPAGYGNRMFEEYNSKHYHQPSDEFQEDWDFTSLAQMAEYGFVLGTTIANQDKLPEWRAGEAFRR
jgi:hypothetical protein